MGYFYYIYIFIMMVLSFLLIINTVRKYRYFGIVDSAVIFSWFYIFIRPLGIDACASTINKYIYFWNEEYYKEGAYFSAFAIILFQLGTFFYSSKVSILNLNRKISLDNKFFLLETEKVLKFFYIFYLFLFLTLFLIYGGSLFSWNRTVAGAFSVALPGFEYFWPFIRVSLFFTLPISLFLFFETKRKSFILIFIVVLISSLTFGRRGILVFPILFFVFIYTFYIFNYKRLKLKSILNIKYFLILGLLYFIAFFGKNFVYFVFSDGVDSMVSAQESMSFFCGAIKKGQQEYDLFWPAVINSYNASNVLNILPAMIGNFIGHEERLLNYTYLYSSTDALMMKYGREVFLYKKFGISPNFYQFYFYYFGYLAFFIVFIVGVVLRGFEIRILNHFFNSNLFKMNFLVLVFSLFSGTFDYTFKYFVVALVYSLLLYYIYKFTMFFIKNKKLK